MTDVLQIVAIVDSEQERSKVRPRAARLSEPADNGFLPAVC